MKFMKLQLLIIALVVFVASSAFASSFSYDVSINTTSLAGQSGYLDLNFAPGINSTLGSASAVVSSFSPAGALTGTLATAGSVSGMLPGTVTLTDSTQFNDYFQSINLGGTFSFLLTLSGTPGSTFGAALYAPDQITPLLTTDPNGWLFTADMTAGQAPTITVSSAQTSVPEPAAAWLLCSGLIGFVGIRRKLKS